MLLFNEEGAASVGEIWPSPQFTDLLAATWPEKSLLVVANRSIRVAV
jgi:hypothetical protein